MRVTNQQITDRIRVKGFSFTTITDNDGESVGLELKEEGGWTPKYATLYNGASLIGGLSQERLDRIMDSLEN